MVFIGLSDAQKRAEIVKYVEKHAVKKIVLFYPLKFPLELPELPCEVQLVDFDEIIMYRTFYPLLEQIDDGYLLVVNELLRTRDRGCLTFNCLRHYLNQCGGQLIFEYFPFIEDTAEFMTLLDFDTRSKYKGSGFEWRMLEEENVLCSPHRYTIAAVEVELPADAAEAYQKEKDRLFDTLGAKNPDTIPRNLHVWCGRYKKPAIRPELQYVARNARFKLPNVTPYAQVTRQPYILLDFQHRRLDMNDFLRRTGEESLTYLSTGFGVDRSYLDSFRRWAENLEEFYAQAGIYSRNG